MQANLAESSFELKLVSQTFLIEHNFYFEV